MNDIILHHYPQSPVSEKVRIGLGIKNAAWRSVEIPRLPPKPDLMPLTGGYRRTPVMQIGADIFCDSDCILHTLDHHIPEPALFRNTPPAWQADEVFDLIFRLVLVFSADAMPPGFVEDRGRLYLGPEWDMTELEAQVPDIVGKLETRFAELDSLLGQERAFLGGDTPTAEDASAYHLVWFLRGRWDGGPALLSALPNLIAWEQNLTSMGHGDWSEMNSGEALDIALNARTATPSTLKESSVPGLEKGQQVTITPDSDGGDPDVTGTLYFADEHRVAIMRDDPRVGEVCVYFPIQGYTIRAL